MPIALIERSEVQAVRPTIFGRFFLKADVHERQAVIGVKGRCSLGIDSREISANYKGWGSLGYDSGAHAALP